MTPSVVGVPVACPIGSRSGLDGVQMRTASPSPRQSPHHARRWRAGR
jgi:hypothetical protein